MMRRRVSLALALTVLLTSFGTLLAAGPSHAGSKGRLNTTLVLGGLTLWQALEGKTTNAVIGGVGTAVAYSRYASARKKEKERKARIARARYLRSVRSQRAKANRNNRVRYAKALRR